MPDAKFSDLTAVTSLDDADLYVLETVGGQSRKITVASMFTEFGAADGWVPDPNAWTRTSNTTFTVAGDMTGVFQKGTRLRVTDTTVKYFAVMGASHSAGTTTVTITGGVDYLLVANPTTRHFSYAASPPGWPTSFGWNGPYTGWTVSPTGLCRFAVFGSMAYFWHTYSSSTSNSTATNMTLPVTATVGGYFAIRYQNNSTHATTPGMGEISGGTVTMYINWGGGAWTASGAKAVGWQMAIQF